MASNNIPDSTTPDHPESDISLDELMNTILDSKTNNELLFLNPVDDIMHLYRLLRLFQSSPILSGFMECANEGNNETEKRLRFKDCLLSLTTHLDRCVHNEQIARFLDGAPQVQDEMPEEIVVIDED